MSDKPTRTDSEEATSFRRFEEALPIALLRSREAVAASLASSLATRTSFEPRAASSSAKARPMPSEPPAITAQGPKRSRKASPSYRGSIKAVSPVSGVRGLDVCRPSRRVPSVPSRRVLAAPSQRTNDQWGDDRDDEQPGCD